MGGLSIVGLGKALPIKTFSNDDFSEFLDTSDEWISTRTGIKERRLCNLEDRYKGEEDQLGLAVAAAREALEDSEIDLNKIDICIVATATPKYAFPATACMVAKELGLSENCMSFDLSAACSGFIYSLNVAHDMLLTKGKDRYALVVGAEEFSKILDFKDRSTCVLFGDGAGAAVVKIDETKAYASANHTRGDDICLISGGVASTRKLSMEGNTVYRFAIGAIEQLLKELVEESKISLEEIGHIVCHQANKRIINHVIRSTKQPEEKFFMNLEHYGNTSAASVPIALKEMQEKGKLKTGDDAYLVGFGAGLTWGGILVNYSGK
ncbi:beta-ketoacyl-ACP synthase III [Lachnospira sp.]|jgi:3-oxoacyl-[acyl-carrier-protein] synthase-3|uniref:beta-ketoacyl-ACP synthase III n=1 Tax=Lachnospira sp. TaxID=2049031 RepID=UPI002579FE5B|nr:beta-ketoacyl-ACP synthase III [Lachnospira sp.]